MTTEACADGARRGERRRHTQPSSEFPTAGARPQTSRGRHRSVKNQAQKQNKSIQMDQDPKNQQEICQVKKGKSKRLKSRLRKVPRGPRRTRKKPKHMQKHCKKGTHMSAPVGKMTKRGPTSNVKNTKKNAVFGVRREYKKHDKTRQ